jgi:hypothetical protein
MGSHARLCTPVVVVVTSLLWLVLIAGLAVSPAHAYQGSVVSVEVVATVSPQATPTKEQSTQQGQPVQTEQVPSWVMPSLLLIGSAILLAALSLLFWIGGLPPWNRQRQPAGWRYEVLLAGLATLAALVALAPQIFTF